MAQSARLISVLRKKRAALNKGSELITSSRKVLRPASACALLPVWIAFLHGEHGQAQARARQRIDRHQRRVRIALVEVFADHGGVVQHQVAIDQGRHRVVGIEVHQVFRRLGRVDRHQFVDHALGGKHQTDAMADHAVG